jgi:hypothetical protein
MSRKLRNSITALLLTSTVCTVGALSLAALPFGVGLADAAMVRTVQEAPATGLEAAAEVAQRESTRPRRMRPSVGMPYFSFVPRG